MKIRGIFLSIVVAIVVTASAAGQGSPSPLTIRLQPFLSGLSLPVQVTSARNGSKRLFVVQQRGIIRVVQPGTNVFTDFLNISSVVSSSGNERGLLGLAFHPQYSTNRRFFVYYTRQADGAIEIAEYQASSSNPNQADSTPVRTIITIPHPSFSNHNGATVAFGPDGFLYAGTGDGGSGNDPQNNAQNINVLLGKFIRIDINTPVGQSPAYNIPPTNPYAGTVPGADEIYAIGMRNPYRFSFDRGGTNQLWVGDVGQDAIEEVDIITVGGNYGWRVYEGTNCTGNDPTLCNPSNYIPPVFQYANAGARCSVTGGVVYRGTQNTFPNGTYLHADYCTGEIFTWNGTTQTMLLDTPRLLSSFGEDEDGEVYVTGLSGTVDKIVRAKASADFDGDFRTDLSVFRPSEGRWILLFANGAGLIQQFGLSGDQPVSEDYDADNISDIAVYRSSNNGWYILRSSNSTVDTITFGLEGDIPTQGDYDGDARADVAIYRPATGTWWIRRSTSPGNFSAVRFGVATDIPAASDYDGDGKYDICVYRPSEGIWYRINSLNDSFFAARYGIEEDIPAPGDFDGDGRSDLVLYRPSQGIWYSFLSANSSSLATRWGISTDIPVTGDYDGDGRDDIAVFRPGPGAQWYILRSSNGSMLATQWGTTGDIPVPRYDAP